MMFVVCGLFLTISVGGFMSMIFTSEIKNGIIRFIISIIIALIIGFGLTGLFYLEYKGDEQKFNSGYCECGGEWELFDVEYRKNSGSLYFYKCKECKETIRLNSEF